MTDEKLIVRTTVDAPAEAGQIFRFAMYHDNHPDGDYEMANKVELLRGRT